ncbi:hypothetical protein RFI_30602 [Reticulomyxa filosa]|uniref:Cell cycle checkpoint protein RAD17 n=1 Tax=Reticulomyxa filosa TaxID=46433 RepID=X6LXY1_RETFI|nr:hypothetical protein RFI_30602 [Reticulomyxa filosa]|eukprot:ETO06788.1 hypothetical protein RFI_30602 [Reticulomyxa filosa]
MEKAYIDIGDSGGEEEKIDLINKKEVLDLLKKIEEEESANENNSEQENEKKKSKTKKQKMENLEKRMIELENANKSTKFKIPTGRRKTKGNQSKNDQSTTSTLSTMPTLPIKTTKDTPTKSNIDSIELRSQLQPQKANTLKWKKATNGGTSSKDMTKSNSIEQSLIFENDQQQWIDKYAPKTLQGIICNICLCMYIFCLLVCLKLKKKKTSELNTQINKTHYFNLSSGNWGTSNVLILIGPPGCGKTSVVECMSRHIQSRIITWPSEDEESHVYSHHLWTWKQHWKEMKDQSNFINNNEAIDIEYCNNRKENSPINRLQRLLQQSCHIWKDKHGVPQVHIFHIHDLPGLTSTHSGGSKKSDNDFIGDAMLQTMVLRACQSSKHIIVFELTSEYEGVQNDLNVFGPQILSHPRVQIIRMNPVNLNLLKACLQHILQLALSKSTLKLSVKALKNIMSDPMIAQIITNCRGDLRNAIQSLQLLFQSRNINTSANADANTNTNTNTNSDANTNSQKTLSHWKEETYSLFHALGKILYAKTNADLSPEECVMRCGMTSNQFCSLLFENFPDFFIFNQNIVSDSQLQRFTDTLHALCDADVCLAALDHFKFHDTSFFSKYCESEDFGQSLYPSFYPVSIASRGYLLSQPLHLDTPVILRNNGPRHSTSKQVIRGSVDKQCQKLQNELKDECKWFLEDCNSIDSHHSISLFNSCNLTLFCTETLPFLSFFTSHPLFRSSSSSSFDQLSLITAANSYSTKYEWKALPKSRFDGFHNNACNNLKANVLNTLTHEPADNIEEIEDSDKD